MSKIYTSAQDELTINAVLGRRGLRAPNSHPKWAVLRIALGQSLKLATPPDEALDRRESSSGGGEYALEQLTGEGKGEDDFTPLIRGLLSVYHDLDLYSDDEVFVRLLQRHVRRGLREIRTSWREGNDFYDFLLHEFFGNATPAKAAENADQGSRLIRALTEIGVKAELQSQTDGPRLTRYKLLLNDANDLVTLQNGLEKLAFILGLGDAGAFLSTTREPRIAALDLPRPASEWHSVHGNQLAGWLAAQPPHWRLPVVLGQQVDGDAFGFDLAAAPHLLIGGTTGSGKSVVLHALLLSMLARATPAELQLVLIDPKHVELAPYARLPHVEKGVITDTSDAIAALTELVTLMEQREVELAKAGTRDIDEARKAGLHWPRIVVVVEEMADLILQSGAVEEPLVRLAQKARAAGIHLVLATQRPDAQTFSGLLRSNVPSRIALTVQKGAESRIILDETGAEKLLGKGDMLVKLIGQAATRVHGVLIGQDDIANGVAAAKRR